MADIIGSYERLPNDAVRAVAVAKRREYSIPVIVTIHTIQTIHTVISNIPYPTDLHGPYLPSIQYQPLMPYQTDHTHHTYPTYHTTPPPHHRGGRGTVPHPHHTTGGEGEDLIWGQYMGRIPWGGRGGGGGRAWCIYTSTMDPMGLSLYILQYIAIWCNLQAVNLVFLWLWWNSIFCLTHCKLHDTLIDPQILTPHAYRTLSQAKHRQALTEVAIYHKVRMLETLSRELSLTLVQTIIKKVGEYNNNNNNNNIYIYPLYVINVSSRKSCYVYMIYSI